MPTFVALLRGINVGVAHRMPMAAWRAQLIGLGYANVRTLLASGNAVFDSGRRSLRDHCNAIGDAVEAGFGFRVPVIVKSAAGLAEIVAGNPFATDVEHPSRLLVAFTQHSTALESLTALDSLVKPPERFHLGRHAAYLYCSAGILGSRAGDALLGKAGRQATTRNWATTLKLDALARGDDRSPRR